MFLICLVVVAAEGSVLARYFTRFTTEIFAVFLSVSPWILLKEVGLVRSISQYPHPSISFPPQVLFIWESVKLAKNEFLHLVTLKNKT